MGKFTLIKGKAESSLVRLSPRDLSRCSTPNARQHLSYEQACTLLSLPLGFLEHYGSPILTIAAARQTPDLEAKLKFITNTDIRIVEVDAESIERAIFLAYNGDDSKLIKATAGVDKIEPTRKIDSEKLCGMRSVRSPENELLCAIIDYAIAVDASDIHLLPKEIGALVQLRVGNSLYSRETRICSLEIYQRLIQRLKIMSRLDITIHDQPQDGGFTIPLLSGKMFARLSILPTIQGEKVVLRLLGREGVRKVEDLHFPDRVVHALENTMKRPSGLIVFCGATGSGKTTSLYAVMEKLSGKNLSLVSVEDPIECVLPWMDQTSVSEVSGLSYSKALRSVLRQDPDVIMIGEIRDEETAQIAFKSALTGHRICTSLHAGSVDDAQLRLEVLGVKKELIDRSISMILYQELVPQLCSRCRIIDSNGSRRINRAIHISQGCLECNNTGFDGRIVLPEVKADGMYFSREDGLYDLMCRGLISLQQFEILSDQTYEASLSSERLHHPL